MWENEVILWEKTEHSWNNFGTETSINVADDPLYAKFLVTWKKQTLGEFIKKLTMTAIGVTRFAEDQNIATGLTLAMTAINLFPVNLKLVKEDEYANKFLELLHEDEGGQQYFDRKEIEDVGEVSSLIDYFIEQKIIKEKGNQLIVNGRVLNRAHIQEK